MQPRNNAEKQFILLTGASGGIGSATARHLASKGYNIVLNARRPEPLRDLAAELSHTYPQQQFDVCPFDFGDIKSIHHAFAQLGYRKIQFSGVVIMPPQIAPTNDPLPEHAEWEAMWKASFIGPLEAIKCALKLIPDTIRGKIAIISGITSAQVLGHYATSNVLRLAWLAEAKTLAFALGERRVHVNSLSLGGVMTEKYTQRLVGKAKQANISIDQQLELEVSNVPLKKYATPLEVAKALEGLLNEFSDHITGMNIICDGGFTRAY